jgi:hypothetical protein
LGLFSPEDGSRTDFRNVVVLTMDELKNIYNTIDDDDVLLGFGAV